jgi:hypothetical protein
MLATQLNSMVEQKQIDRNSLVKLTGYSMNIVQNRRYISPLINFNLATPITHHLSDETSQITHPPNS